MIKDILRPGAISAIALLSATALTPARAATNEELQAQINALTAKLDQLSAQLAAKQQPLPTRSPNAPPVGSAPIADATPSAAPATQPFIPAGFKPPGGVGNKPSPLSLGNDDFSVSLYGILSVSAAYVSDTGGSSKTLLVPGAIQTSRLGLKTYWNLGDESAAFGIAELGFNSTNGNLLQQNSTASISAARLFGRQFFLGFENPHYGTLTVGRQYDEVVQTLDYLTAAYFSTTAGVHVGDPDDYGLSNRLNNAVRYATPKYHDVTLSASYAFSESASGGDNNAYSAGASYDPRVNGQGLYLAAATSYLNHPNSATNGQNGATDNEYGASSPWIIDPNTVNGANQPGVANQHTVGVGGSYTTGPVTVAANYTDIGFNYLKGPGNRTTNDSLDVQNAEIWATYKFTPKLLVGLGNTYTWGDYSFNKKPEYEQINFGIDYFWSSYVDLSVSNVYQIAGGYAKNAYIDGFGKSAAKNENVLIAGTRLTF